MTMDQTRAPIWEALLAYRDKQTARFHVPGHKGGAGLDAEASALLGSVYALDVTEITGMDDLHQPEGIIAEAQQLAAACYGADHTFLLVGGSTAGNLALILALCKPGDTLLVQRDAHKSIINGLMLAGARAVFLAPRIDSQSGLPLGLRPEDVEAALERNPEAVGLFITDPNYYGIGIPLRPLIEAAHARGKPVLVDAAHGAHYGFHPALPESALAAGADGVVHSTHKMLTAMTMGAMLHLQGSRLRREAVASALAAVQSSSPSYPIMASLDLARRQLATQGAPWLEQAVSSASSVRDQLAMLPWLAQVPSRETIEASSVKCDPFKLTLADRTGTLSGFELMHELERRGCYSEMADPRHVTLAFGPAMPSSDTTRLIDALLSISREFGLSEQELQTPGKNINKEAEAPLGVHPAWLSEPVAFPFHSPCHTAQVNIADAAGYPAGTMIVPYPPGVPLLYPGETITRTHIKQLNEWIQAGSRVHGLGPDHTLCIRTNGD